MNNLICYDFEDKVISHFTQWDINHTITIKDLNLTEAPIFHFSNKHSKVALCVQSVLDDNGYITAKVPNVLLREAVILDLYIYVTKNDTSITAYSTNFAVRARPKPADYIYSDNVEVIYIEDVMNKINETETDLLEVMNDAAVALNGLNTAKQEAETLSAVITEKLNNGDFIGEQGIQGEQGVQGEKGNDGFSPVVSVMPLENGHNVTITDSTGNTTFTVLNGQRGEPGQDYVLSDTDKQQIADLAVTNASEAASNANSAAQAATDIVENINSKLANGDFNGADYVLTAADKTEIANLVTPLAASMQGGTVTYKVPKSHCELEIFNGAIGQLPLYKVVLDTPKFESDLSEGIIQEINESDYSTKEEYYNALVNLYLSYAVISEQYKWSFTPNKNWIYYLVSDAIPSNNDTQYKTCLVSQVFNGYFDIRLENITPKSFNIADGRIVTDIGISDFAVHSSSASSRFAISSLSYGDKILDDGKQETIIYLTFAVGGAVGETPLLNIGNVGNIALTFTPNNTYVEADENESV